MSTFFFFLRLLLWVQSFLSWSVSTQRKPEEEIPVKDTDAKQAKQETTVNGSSDSSANKGNGVQEASDWIWSEFNDLRDCTSWRKRRAGHEVNVLVSGGFLVVLCFSQEGYVNCVVHEGVTTANSPLRLQLLIGYAASVEVKNCDCSSSCRSFTC